MWIAQLARQSFAGHERCCDNIRPTEMNRNILPCLLCTALFITVGSHSARLQEPDSGPPHPIQIQSEVKHTHDPSIVKESDRWFSRRGSPENMSRSNPVRAVTR